MESPQAIELLRRRVTEAKQVLDKATATKETRFAENKRLHAFRVVKDPGNGRTHTEYIVNNTDQARKWAEDDARTAELAEIEAREVHSGLRRELADAERPDPLPLEQLESNLAALVEQDDDLYAQMEDQIVALQAIFGEWNDHIEAKIAIRRERCRQGELTPDIGMVGKVDVRWGPWLTAEYSSDAALHRQFTLLANGQGYMNRLPTEYTRAVERIRQSAKHT